MLEDPNPQAGLDFGSALAIAEDASSIVVGAGGRVVLNAISGGSDTAVDGRVRTGTWAVSADKQMERAPPQPSCCGLC